MTPRITRKPPTSCTDDRRSPKRSVARVIVQTGSTVETRAAWAAPIRAVPA
jgi:hypothetical protein